MFKAVCVREESGFRPGVDGLDLGVLAEAMLFYQRVHVIGGAGTLEQLAMRCGPKVLEELLAEGYFEMSYYPDHPSVLTENTGTLEERHLPTVVKFGQHELQHVLPEVCARVTGAKGKGRRLAQRIAPHIETFTHDSDVEAHSRSDFRDQPYVATAFRTILTELVPDVALPERLRVATHEAGDDRIAIETNVDFNSANLVYHERVSPEHSSLSPAYLLSHLVTVRADLDIAARFEADLSVSPITGALARAKVSGLLNRYARSAEHLERFQEYVFDEARAVREAINSGSRSMADVLQILTRATRFRDWLRGQPADGDLMKEYFRAVTGGTWIDALPAKVARFSFVSLAGIAFGTFLAGAGGALAGLGIGAADTFLLEHIARGWRPNQFVEGPLKKFVHRQ